MNMNIDEMSVRNFIFPPLTLYTIYMQIELPQIRFSMLIRCKFALTQEKMPQNNNL